MCVVCACVCVRVCVCVHVCGVCMCVVCVCVKLLSKDVNDLSLGYPGKNQEALEAFTRVLQLQPSHTTAMLGQARLHRTLGHDREAEDLFLK